MLFRKIERKIRRHLVENPGKVAIVSGARQIGKSFIIRHVGKDMFRNFVELNLVADRNMREAFARMHTTDDFYLVLSAFAGGMVGSADDTLIFLDEIQECPNLLTLLKFLNAEKRFRYIASGSLLGVTLHRTTSIPVGSIEIMPMFPLDFEEFLLANDFGREAI